MIKHLGRCDDLVKFKGRIINPVRIEEILREIDVNEVHTDFDYQIRISEFSGAGDKYSEAQEGTGLVVDFSFRAETGEDVRSGIEETFLREIRAEFGIAVPVNRIEGGPERTQRRSAWKSKRVTRARDGRE